MKKLTTLLFAAIATVITTAANADYTSTGYFKYYPCDEFLDSSKKLSFSIYNTCSTGIVNKVGGWGWWVIGREENELFWNSSEITSSVIRVIVSSSTNNISTIIDTFDINTVNLNMVSSYDDLTNLNYSVAYPIHSRVLLDETVSNLTLGHYVKLNLLNDLNVTCLTNADYLAKDKISVKVEGLVKGLKLVVNTQKNGNIVTNANYYIEGIPTEALDGDTNPMYARVTITKGKVKSDTLVPLDISVTKHDTYSALFNMLNVNTNIVIDMKQVWPEFDTTWSIKGLPVGLKFDAKAGTIAGTPTKGGAYPITVSHPKMVGKVKYTEFETAVMNVWGDEYGYAYTNQQYVAITPIAVIDVKSMSGLPTGLKFDAKVGTISGTPIKSGVFYVTKTMANGDVSRLLWKIEAGENTGFLANIDWTVTDKTVSLTQGVANSNWNLTLDSNAKVSVSGLPSGLKLAKDKTTKEWRLSGTATKAGNYVVTIKTTLNGVTTVERIAMNVADNPWTGTWYGFGLMSGSEYGTNYVADVTVSANGRVKLVINEATANGKGRKITVSTNTIDDNGISATINLTKSNPVTYTVNFKRKRILADGARLMTMMPRDTSSEEIDSWKPISTVVANEVIGLTTNAYAYMVINANASKKTFKVTGKLWDGSAINATVGGLLGDIGGSMTAPFLMRDKQKNSVMITFDYIEDTDIVFCEIAENGEIVNLAGESGIGDECGTYVASDFKGKKFNQICTNDVVCICHQNPLDPTELNTYQYAIPVATLKASVPANGLMKTTIKTVDGWTWVCELLPVNNEAKQFSGFATGTKKGEATQTCIAWIE